MADQAAAPLARPHGYAGKPANKRNANAKQLERKPGPGPKPRKTAPAHLPPPQRFEKPTEQARSLATDSPPFQDAVFAHNFADKETNVRTSFQPSLSSMDAVVSDTYQVLLGASAEVQKLLLPEYFRYYAAALTWVRIISIKSANGEQLSATEREFLLSVQASSFNIPEPLFLFIRGFGNVTTATGEHLFSSFPEMPTTRVAAFGGYYGPIDLNTHNLYEEIPALGVYAESVRHSLSNDPMGNYASALTTPRIRVTNALLGYKPLGHRRAEAKNIAIQLGITDQLFPSTIRDTCFNLKFVLAISQILARMTVFKNHSVNVAQMAPTGTQSQTIITSPTANPDILNVNSDVQPFSLIRQPAGQLGMAVIFGYNLVKEGDILNDDYLGWCCATNVALPPMIDNAWVNNRNDRRDIPDHYKARVFYDAPTNASDIRSITIQDLAK